MDDKSRMKMKCPKCDGEGKIVLPMALADTMDVAIRSVKPFTARDVSRILDIRFTAACNRLAKLYDIGLLTRKPDGSQPRNPMVYRVRRKSPKSP